MPDTNGVQPVYGHAELAVLADALRALADIHDSTGVHFRGYLIQPSPAVVGDDPDALPREPSVFLVALNAQDNGYVIRPDTNGSLAYLEDL